MTQPEHDCRCSVRDWAVLTILSVALWQLVGVFEGAWYVVMSSGKPGPHKQLRDALSGAFAFWLMTGLSTPLLVWIAWRTSIEPGLRRRASILHLTAALVYACTLPVADTLVYQLGHPQHRQPFVEFCRSIPGMFAFGIHRSLLAYFVIVGAAYLFVTWRRYGERARAAAALEVERSRLRASLSDARLEALQMQLQPHFLFNVHHAISTLIMAGQPQAANRMLVQLSQFLRMTLEGRHTPLVPLVVELEFVEAYLLIQKERFGDRLQVEQVVSAEALRGIVPHLILQPLIENAIRHGIASDPGAATIVIRAVIVAGQLRVEVEDDGAGPPDTGVVVDGVGLGNVRARLAEIYPGAHDFAIGGTAGKGALVSLTIPYRVAEEDAAP